jgi:hypothetical protein
VSFDPFLYLQGIETLKNHSNDLLRLTFGTIYGLFPFLALFVCFRTFLVIFLLNKVLDERVEGSFFFVQKGESPPLNSDPLRTMVRPRLSPPISNHWMIEATAENDASGDTTRERERERERGHQIALAIRRRRLLTRGNVAATRD